MHQGYGLTEASPGVTTTLGERDPKPGSVGRPLPNVELRIADEQGEDVEGDDPGEILIRGGNLFSGYWPDGVDGPDEDGWYRTGDVGYLDADGDLFLVDRLRELIIVSGFNVFPSEVEEVLVGAPGVREAAVIGVPSEETGEAVKAFVVPETGATRGHRRGPGVRRDAAGAVQVPGRDRGGRPSAALGHRQGRQGTAPADR